MGGCVGAWVGDKGEEGVERDTKGACATPRARQDRRTRPHQHDDIHIRRKHVPDSSQLRPCSSLIIVVTRRRSELQQRRQAAAAAERKGRPSPSQPLYDHKIISMARLSPAGSRQNKDTTHYHATYLA